jgi:hypothetical protein
VNRVLRKGGIVGKHVPGAKARVDRVAVVAGTEVPAYPRSGFFSSLRALKRAATPKIRGAEFFSVL